jgi:hypothetical protein
MVVESVISMAVNVPRLGSNWENKRGFVMPLVPGPQLVATRTPGAEVD